MSWNDTVCIAVSNCNLEGAIADVSTARSDWATALNGRAAPHAQVSTAATNGCFIATSCPHPLTPSPQRGEGERKNGSERNSYDLHPRLRQPEDEHRVAERIADLEVPARRHGDELLAVHFEHRRRGVGAGAAVELPQHGAGLGVVRLEPAVALAGVHQAARGGGRTAHHRQLGLHGPGDLPGVQVDRVDIAVLTRVAALVVGDAHEGAAEP